MDVDAGVPSCSIVGPFDVLESGRPDHDPNDAIVPRMDVDLLALAGHALVVAHTTHPDPYVQDAVVAARIDAAGDASEPSLISEDQFRENRLPSVAPRGSSDYRVYWAEPDLRYRDVDGATGAAEGTSELLAGDTADGTPSAVLGLGDGSTLVLWVEPDDVMAALVDASGAPIAESAPLRTDPPLTFPLRLASFGESAFALFRAGEGYLATAAIDDDAQGIDDPERISQDATTIAHFDLASQPDARAAVFEVQANVRHEVHFVPLSLAGKPAAAERVLSGNVDQGFEPSLAPLAGGYAVAWRHARTGQPTTVRFALVDAGGAILQTLDVAEVGSTIGPVRVRVGPDGVGYLVWQDQAEVEVPDLEQTVNGSVVRAAVFTCE